jgi:flagellar hook protein FlgE
MSITSALYTGVSGLLNNSEAMNVIGNNISNVNTLGFKQARSLFSDLLSQNVSNDSQIGKGVQLQVVQNVFSQGTTQATENVTDLAIQGNSFFALKAPDTNSPVTTQAAAYLSRAGAFKVDSTLTLVNPDSYQVLDTAGNPIRFSDNAAGIATAATAAATDITDATTAIDGDISTAQTAVNGIADATAKAAAQALVDAATALNDAATTAADTLKTDPTGTNATAANTTLQAAFAALQRASAAAGTTVPAATTTAVSKAGASYGGVATEEGKAFGKIIGIDTSGLITYLAPDGVTQNFYNTSGATGVAVNAANAATVQRIAVVNANDPTGLLKVGGSLYQSSQTSGVPTTGFTLAGNKANGTSNQILSNSLEGSNVDMASEFVKMITTQRAYSANSKTITTADQMTQEVLQLIR